MTILEVYADESSQNSHKYMVLGGIVVISTRRDQVLTAFREIRGKHRLFGELKWGKISSAKLHVYKEFIDCFFAFYSENVLHFHSLVIDTSKLDHAQYNKGNAEIGFSKFIYQLLIKFGRLYHAKGNFHVHLDDRTTRQSLEELRQILNSGIRKRWGVDRYPYKRVQFLESHKSDFLQVVDLLIGAIAFVKNGHYLKSDASPARKELADYICQRACLPSLGHSTPMRMQKFTIWIFVGSR